MKAELLKDGVTQHKNKTPGSIHPGKSAKEWWQWRGHPWGLLSTSWEEPGAALHADMHKSTQHCEGGTLRVSQAPRAELIHLESKWLAGTGPGFLAPESALPTMLQCCLPNQQRIRDWSTKERQTDKKTWILGNRRSLKSKSPYQMFLWTFHDSFAHPFLSLPSSTPHILSSTLPAPLTTLFPSFQRECFWLLTVSFPFHFFFKFPICLMSA